MKIFLVIAFYLISGQVTCSDVIGYSGGSVIIFSNINWHAHDSKYICKVKEKGCKDIIRVDTKYKVQYGRFKLYSSTKKDFLVFIRKLKKHDAGTYRVGLGNQSNFTVNLKVNESRGFACPKINTVHLGENITIACKYPKVYVKNYKLIYTVDDATVLKEILETKKNPQIGRFSISDDRKAKVLRVNISNVREADELVYLFGVHHDEGAVRYNTFFAEIQLHIAEQISKSLQPKTPETHTMTSAALPSGSVNYSSFIIISVCVCAALLLIAGFVLMIYKLKGKTAQGSVPSSRRHPNANNKEYSDNRNGLVYENLDLTPSRNRTHSMYEHLNPETQVNTVYNAIQSSEC